MTSIPNKKSGSQFKLYLTNFVWLMGDNLLTNLFGLIVLAVVARYLGPEEYGAYAYVFSLAQLFAVLGQMGLDGLLTRQLVENPHDHRAVLGTAGGLRFAGYFLGALLCLIYAFAVPGHSTTEHWLFVSAFLFIVFTPGPVILENWFRARVEARFSSMARMFGTLVGGILKIALVLLGAGVVAVGFAQAATMLLIFLVSLPLFLSRGGPAPHRWTFEPDQAKEMLAESWTVFLGALLAVIYLKIDQVMLRWWDGTEAVGIYAIASRMSELLYFLPAALVTTFFPRLIALRKVSETAYEERFQGLLCLLTLLAYCALIGIYLLGPLVIKLALGPAYVAAIPVLMVHMLSMPFIFQRFAFSRWLIIERFTVFSVVSQGVGALTNVLLNLILIPRYSMMGAAVATFISYTFASYLALLVSERTRPAFFMMTKALVMPWKALSAIKALRAGKAD